MTEAAVGLYSAGIVGHAVDCTTVDAFMDETGINHIDLLKIDTEGHDISVLKGTRRALTERKIGMIRFEVIPAAIATRVTMRDFREILKGYGTGRLCPNG